MQRNPRSKDTSRETRLGTDSHRWIGHVWGQAVIGGLDSCQRGLAVIGCGLDSCIGCFRGLGERGILMLKTV